MAIQRLDRQGRTIYFIEYANQKDQKGNEIELWEPEDIFLAREYLTIKLETWLGFRCSGCNLI